MRLQCIQSHSSLALFVMIVFTAVVLWFIWNLWCFMHSSSLYNLLYWRYSVFLFVHFYISFFLFLNSKKSCENCDLFNQLKNKTRKRNTELKDYVNWSRKSEQIKKKKEGEKKPRHWLWQKNPVQCKTIKRRLLSVDIAAHCGTTAHLSSIKIDSFVCLVRAIATAHDLPIEVGLLFLSLLHFGICFSFHSTFHCIWRTIIIIIATNACFYGEAK